MVWDRILQLEGEVSTVCSYTPEEIMDKLEQRVGPKGRKLFEQFLRKVNKLQMQQHLEAQARMGVTERSREPGPG